MINTNLKTQVQARIDAITGGTTLTELLRIQTQANGLGCNTTLLTSQIQARLAALNGSTSLTDLTIAALLAEGKSDRAYYQVPFAVAEGDKLFIDAFGAVKNRKWNGLVCTTAEFNTGFSTYNPTTIPARTVASTTAYSDFFGVVGLSDGGFVGLRLFRTNASAELRLRATVMSATGVVLSDQTTAAIDGASGLITSDSSTLQIIAVREQSANVFRVYCLTAESGGDAFRRRLSYFTMTYNAVSFAVTLAAGASLLFLNGTDEQWVLPQMMTTQGEPFYLLRTNTNKLYVLNTAASTATQIAALGTSVTVLNRGLAGGTYGAIVSSGARLIVRADTGASQPLPANLTSDGCFAPTHNIELLSGRLWISISPAGVVKLVSFAADYTTCNIYSLGTVETGVVETILKHGDSYTVGFGTTVFSFTWTGSSAPTNFLVNAGFRLTDRENFTRPYGASSTLRRIVNTDTMFCSAAAFNAAQSTCRVLYLRADPSEYMAYDAQVFATCLTSAAASGFAEIQLEANTKIAPGAVSGYATKAHQNLLTTLSPRSPSTMVYRGSAYENASEVLRLIDRHAEMVLTSERPVSLNGAVVAINPDQTYVFNHGSFTLLTPFTRFSVGTDASALRNGVIESRTSGVVATLDATLQLLSQKDS